jgi:hypothetical protein
MTRPFPNPCLDCGKLTTHGARCQEHTIDRTRQRDATRRPNHDTYYGPDYRRRAKQIRDNATICWICKGGWVPSDPWTADHLEPGNPNSQLAPAHRSCNSKRGNKPLTDPR